MPTKVVGFRAACRSLSSEICAWYNWSCFDRANAKTVAEPMRPSALSPWFF